MKSTRRILLWLAAFLLVALIWIFWPKENASPFERSSSKPRHSSRDLSQGFPQVHGNPENPTAESPIPPDPAVLRLIERCLARFVASAGAEESAAILKELREGIHAAEEMAALAAIAEFLKSNQDAATHLPFIVGPEGVMETTPTLRIALLDLLPSLDPLAALEIARGIMDQKKSPDEYAVALRNLAWNDLDGDLKAELSERFEQMIETKEWRVAPSAGFLEGLDAAVEIGGESMFDAIIRLNRDALADSSPALARAALVVLDRMVVRDPALLVNAFTQNPGLSGLSPDQRASLMSRLDLADPAQRHLFSRYLNDSSHGPTELDYFTRLFPNGNYLHGNWLITSGEAPHSIDSRLVEDRKILTQIEEMIAANPGQRANQSLVRIRDRLQKLVVTPAQK